jgi:hypothetical protein
MKHTRWLLLLALVAWASPSMADDDKKLASERFRAGEKAFAKGAFGVAAEAWERAGELERAATIADRVAAEASGDVRVAADALLARVTAKLSTVDVIGPGAARVRVGAREVSPPSKLRLKPGTYVVSVQDAEGGVREQRMELGAGASQTIDATTPSPPTPAEAPPAAPARAAPELAVSATPTEPPSRGVPALAWASFGLAAAGVGAFAFFGARTLDAQRTYEATPTAANRDAFYESRTISNVSLAAAGVFAVTGVVFVLGSRSGARTGAGGRVTLGANAGGAAIGGRF